MNYWYIARHNELFIDTDNAERSLKHTQSRLQGAIECRYLSVLSVMQRPSKRANHIHTIITLDQPIDDIERYIWEIILHGDIYRGCCTIMRQIKHVPCPDVLISPHRYFTNDGITIRHSDRVCRCKEKHKRSVMEKCPIATELRGRVRTIGFFGKPSNNPCTIWPQSINNWPELPNRAKKA